ncbi:AraC family transcriptional regulator [Dongia sp.]|uniref:AraC family transcriptional regulator n=1 Tax=Dongia sp. TaxID=1977262 RepID=UPI0035B4B864
MSVNIVSQSRPLSGHPAFAVSDFDRLAGILEAQFGADIAELPGAGHVNATINCARLKDSELWYCIFGTPLSAKFPDSDHLRLQLQHRGVGGTWQGRRLAPVTEQFGCISRAEIEIDLAEDFEQLAWRIPKGKLEQKLSLMIGRPIGYALTFAPSLDLTSSAGAMLKQVFHCLLRAVECSSAPASHLVVAELEQALIGTFLATADHSGRALLEGRASRASPWQVRRAEAHIEANWDKPIAIEDLVAACGTSARSLFRSFKENRGCTPMEFTRRLRLHHARRMLEHPHPATTVTDVAFACGFGDLGRFAKEFHRAFGERPSELLARRRDNLAVA